jgi:hypothetical protein
MPFRTGFFEKVFSQDGDAWLSPMKHILMAEIYRVTAPNGLFAYQTYVDSRDMPKRALAKTKVLLRECGFRQTSVVHGEDVEEMFESAGFQVESKRSLHNVYSQDNLRMLENLRRKKLQLLKTYVPADVDALGRLLQWEQRLFSERWWTGVLILARKLPGW